MHTFETSRLYLLMAQAWKTPKQFVDTVSVKMVLLY